VLREAGDVHGVEMDGADVGGDEGIEVVVCCFVCGLVKKAYRSDSGAVCAYYFVWGETLEVADLVWVRCVNDEVEGTLVGVGRVLAAEPILVPGTVGCDDADIDVECAGCSFDV
jgi:hypothetical protein